MKKFHIRVNGQNYDVEVEEVSLERKPQQSISQDIQTKTLSQNTSGKIVAPMPGVITAIKVILGDQVSSDQTILTLEAMKMENEIPAGKAGKVKEINVQVSQSVSAGELLMVIE